MKSLNEKRDELADEYIDGDACLGKGTVQSPFDEQHNLDSFNAGFDAALQELMPQVNKLVEALMLKKSKLIKRDCDCGYEGPDSDHGHDAPMCYRCEDIFEIDHMIGRWQKFIGDEK